MKFYSPYKIVSLIFFIPFMCLLRPAAADPDPVQVLQAVREDQARLLANYEVGFRMWTEGENPTSFTQHRIVYGNRLRRDVRGSWESRPHFVQCQTADGHSVSNWNEAGTAGYLGSIRPQSVENWNSLFNSYDSAPWLFGLVEQDKSFLWDLMLEHPESLKAREISEGDGIRIEISSKTGEDELKLIVDPSRGNRICGLSYRRGSGNTEKVEGTARIEEHQRIGKIWAPKKGRLDCKIVRPHEKPIDITYCAQIDQFSLLDKAPPGEVFAIRWPAHCLVGDSSKGEDESKKLYRMADKNGRLIALDSLVPTHPGIRSTAGLGKDEKARLAKDLRCMVSWLVEGRQPNLAFKAIDAAKMLESGQDIAALSTIQPFGLRLLQMAGLNVDSEIKIRALILIPEKKN